MSRPPLHSNSNFPKPMTSIIYRLPNFAKVTDENITDFFQDNYQPIIEGNNEPKPLNPFFDKNIKEMNKSLKKNGIARLNFDEVNKLYTMSISDTSEDNQELLNENSELVNQAILNELIYRDLLKEDDSDSENGI